MKSVVARFAASRPSFITWRTCLANRTSEIRLQAVAITVREKSGDVAGLVVAVSEVADSTTIRISIEQLRRRFTAVAAERRGVGRIRSGIDMSRAHCTVGVGFARVIFPFLIALAVAAVVPVS